MTTLVPLCHVPSCTGIGFINNHISSLIFTGPFGTTGSPLFPNTLLCAALFHIYPNIKALKGEFSGYYRYRVGDYRVIYEIDDNSKLVTILLIAHRSRVYE